MKLLGLAGGLIHSFLDLFYAPVCLGCGCEIFGTRGSTLCTTCENQIRHHDNRGCSFCGSAAGDYASLGHGCSHCRPSSQHYTRAVGAVQYSNPVRDMVHHFKYQQATKLADPFSCLMQQRIPASGLPEFFDAVVPVPLHPKRLRWRGYNQSQLLAERIAEQGRWDLSVNVLKRVKNTASQALLLPIQRKENIRDAFAAPEGSFTGKTVLLVDDVMTTGHTVSECADVLRQAGAKHVYVLVFAR